VEKLPPCPSWCSGEHADDFAACMIPLDGSASQPIWGLVHHRRVQVASATVEIFHVVHVRTDGFVVASFAPDISWDHGDAAPPTAAADMASALLTATTLVGSAPASADMRSSVVGVLSGQGACP
jgi:hypothetical protein